MSDDQVGLPAAMRREVADAVRANVAALGTRPTPEHALACSRELHRRLVTITRGQQPIAAVFEVAWAAAAVIVDGVHPNSGWQFLGRGRNEANAVPTTPLEYRIAEFTTTVMRRDRDAGWQLWAAWPRPLSEEIVTKLVANAWLRSAGGQLLVKLPASKWPPVCDFCCGAVAAWMWHCEGADLVVSGRNGNGDMALRMDDFEYWFGCDDCRPLVARPQPDWEQVWARHLQAKPHADRASVQLVLDAYQQQRRGWQPVTLPAQRPQPTPGRQ